MPINETLLPEFDQEMASTRKTLERVPPDRFQWTPPCEVRQHGVAGRSSRQHSWLGDHDDQPR